MIKRLICWLWGCKVVVKAYTGETMAVTNGLGTPLQASLYRWERQPFCVRCGKDASVDSRGAKT